MEKDTTDEWLKYLSLSERGEILGECNGCGNCCVMGWRFEYTFVHKGDKEWDENTKLEGLYNFIRPFHRHPCSSYNLVTKKCKLHDKDKPAVCKYWPFLKTDMQQCGCKGYHIKDENIL